MAERLCTKYWLTAQGGLLRNSVVWPSDGSPYVSQMQGYLKTHISVADGKRFALSTCQQTTKEHEKLPSMQ